MTQKYLKNKRITSGRAIYKILERWKNDFVKRLEQREGKGAFYEMKDDIVDGFIADIKYDLPDYFEKELPTVMEKGAKANITKYSELLPTGYSLAFDLPTSPASNYVRDLADLHLSTRDGSTLKTTRDELRRIIADGLDNNGSYGSIAKDIQTLDPFVFSKTRAKLIAVNEVGRAYGWADSEPARGLSSEYVMEKQWETSNDEKVRPDHVANQAEGWIPMEKSWKATGDEYAPSHDINCRCTSTDQITGIKEVRKISEDKSEFDKLIEKIKTNKDDSITKYFEPITREDERQFIEENGLTEEEASALKLYGRSGYEGSYTYINGVLRNDDDSKKGVNGVIYELINGLEKLKGDDSQILYRGVSERGVVGELIKNLKVGDTWLEKGVFSTSSDASVAETFAGKGGYIFRVTGKGKNISPIADIKGEKEYIFTPGSKFEIIKIDGSFIDIKEI